MASPLIKFSDLLSLSLMGGYNQSPALSQLSAVFLLSSCQVMRQKWLWQSPIAPISNGAYNDILEMIAQAEAQLMQSVNIGQIVPSVGNLTADIFLLLDGSVVAQSDYPELSSVVPSAWLVGSDIILPNMQETSLHGDNGSNVGAVVGENSVTLDVSQIPSHNHTQNPHNHTYVETSSIPTAAGIEPTFADLTTQVPSLTGNSIATNNPAGGDQPHNNVPRSLAVYWYIVAR